MAMRQGQRSTRQSAQGTSPPQVSDPCAMAKAAAAAGMAHKAVRRPVAGRAEKSEAGIGMAGM